MFKSCDLIWFQFYFCFMLSVCCSLDIRWCHWDTCYHIFFPPQNCLELRIIEETFRDNACLMLVCRMSWDTSDCCLLKCLPYSHSLCTLWALALALAFSFWMGSYTEGCPPWKWWSAFGDVLWSQPLALREMLVNELAGVCLSLVFPSYK